MTDQPTITIPWTVKCDGGAFTGPSLQTEIPIGTILDGYSGEESADVNDVDIEQYLKEVAEEDFYEKIDIAIPAGAMTAAIAAVRAALETRDKEEEAA